MARPERAAGLDDGPDPTREAILEAALACFGTKGFRATSLSRVAAAAGVSRPTLYARYPDKVELFRAVVERAFRDALVDVDAVAARDADLETRLRDTLLAYFGGLFDRFHDLPQIDELALVQSEHADDLVTDARAAFQRKLTRLLRREIEAGRVDPARLGIPLARLVDLIRLAPLSLKGPATTRTQYRRELGNFARLVAKALDA